MFYLSFRLSEGKGVLHMVGKGTPQCCSPQEGLEIGENTGQNMLKTRDMLN